MRVSEQRQEAPDVLEAQLDPEPLETIEMVESRRVIHRSGGAKGAGGLKVPRGGARGRFPPSNEAHSYISRMRKCLENASPGTAPWGEEHEDPTRDRCPWR